jgi:uncharacterized protein YndB with AHSA1/START domain
VIRRDLVLPTDVDALWELLTRPELAGEWFGADVEWELRPGAAARFTEADGSVRTGTVEAVEPATHLRWRWEREDGEGESEVSYDLEPAEDGTRLVVTERAVTGAPEASASTRRASESPAWTTWDDRAVGMWCRLGRQPVRAPRR